MTGLEVYLLVAPFILAAVGWLGVYAFFKWSEREDRRTKQSGRR